MNLWPSTLRAALAGGLAAGAVAATFSVVIVEPTVRLALAVEDSRGAMDIPTKGAWRGRLPIPGRDVVVPSRCRCPPRRRFEAAPGR